MNRQRRRGPVVGVVVVVALLAVVTFIVASQSEDGGNGQEGAAGKAEKPVGSVTQTTFAVPTSFVPPSATRVGAPTTTSAERSSKATTTTTKGSKTASSAPATTPRLVGKPLAGRTVVIDPGHQLGNSRHLDEINRLVNAGGFMKPCNSTGTATNGGFPEATFNWDVALALRARLSAEGAKVVMTRTTNSYSAWGPCVDARGRWGNAAHADAVISIHGDGADAPYRGFFVIMPGLLHGWTDDIYTSSHRLGTYVHTGLVQAGATIANDYGGTGYSVRTDLGTLNWSNVPVVMVELGNMRNETDAAHMTSESYRDTVYARGLADGVTAFLRAK